MQNTTSYNQPQDASTPAVQAEAPIMGGKCDGPAGMGGAFESGGSSNQAGSGFATGGLGGKADNCVGMADKKTPAPEVAQGGPLQTYSGDAGWKN
jgi:hypothetical protein